MILLQCHTLLIRLVRVGWLHAYAHMPELMHQLSASLWLSIDAVRYKGTAHNSRMCEMS